MKTTLGIQVTAILRHTRLLALSLAGLLSIGAGKLRAQDAPPQDYPQDQSQDPAYQEQGPQTPNGDIDYNGDPSQDPPDRVARLSYIDGSVSFQPGGQGDWGTASRNRPVTIGDKIWSDNNSRAELQAGPATIHVSSMTALSFLNLDDQTTQMRLAEGTINFRIREMREGDVYEVDTPNLAFNVTQAGAFRIEVNENGDGTRVTVIRGEGQVIANGQNYTIHSGERGEFNGTDNVSYFVASAPAADDFDRWSNDRDRGEDNSVSARYVSRDVPGYSDLDNNGTWNEEQDYGPVWYPNVVDAGWAPYSDGYWNYIGPWGWTWVDYSSWGFAPYHYGRWAFIGSRWGWCPGPYYARPIYGPAFVGFLGGGFGFGFGRGIGWFPLGPHEFYRPWYRTSGAYFRNVNVRNTFIRNTNVFVNRGGRGGNFNYAYAHNSRAVTVASRNNFVGGHAINRGAFHVTDANLRGAQVTNRANFSPTRQSYMGANASRGNISRPSAAVQNRYVMARTAPAAGAAHMNVRTFGNGNNSFGRGGANNDRPAMGRAAQMNAANNNRSFSGNSNRPNGNLRNDNSANNGRANYGGFRSDANRPGNAQANGQFGSRSGVSGNSPGMTARQRELSQDKPQSRMRTGNEGGTRSWSAQGNSTDRGRAPAGFGSDSRGDSGRSSNVARNDRPNWANGANGNRPSDSGSRGGYAGDRPSYSNGNGSNGGRSYNPPQRSSGGFNDRPANNGGGRSYSPPNMSNRASSQPNRGYSQPNFGGGNRGNSQPRSYSAPSAPSRSYSAPSRSYGGGGGGGGRSYGGGGGAPRGGGGGGSPHSGGGGGSSHGGGGSPHGRH